MNNELIWILAFALEFSLLMLTYRFMGRVGLMVWIGIMTIIANIQVQKTVILLGCSATLGNVSFATIFLASDILSENYSRRDALATVFLGFFIIIATSIMMHVSLLFTPAPSDFAHGNIEALFTVLPRLAIASAVAYIISQFYDIYCFDFIKRHYPSTRHLWIRNNVSTLIAQLLDSWIFTAIAFYGILPKGELKYIFLSTYIIKALLALLDTPFMYLAAWMKKRNWVREQ